MRLLVDMDGVTANFEKGVLDTYRGLYPDKLFIPLHMRETFYVKEQYPPKLQPLIEQIYLSQGFYLSLQPIEGATEALIELSSKHEVFLCTSPLLANPYCIKEKYEWVPKQFSKEWTKKMIVTDDKTIIQADILIDDKPEIKGIQKPSWENILYSQPYNLKVTSKRRLTWKTYKQILNLD